MKFKYLNEADTEFDLYPVIKDLQKLNKEFQKEGEILWANKSGPIIMENSISLRLNLTPYSS